MCENMDEFFFNIKATYDFFEGMAEEDSLIDTVVFCSEHDFARPLYFKITPEGAAAVCRALAAGVYVLSQQALASLKTSAEGAANDH